MAHTRPNPSPTITPTTALNKNPDLQGEGNYDAARRYDKSASDFAKSGQVQQAAQNAKPQSTEEAQDLRRAEEEGKSHSKGER